jgi:hypothetical protein
MTPHTSDVSPAPLHLSLRAGSAHAGPDQLNSSPAPRQAVSNPHERAVRRRVHLRLGGWGMGWHDSCRATNQLDLSAASPLEFAAPSRLRRLDDHFALASQPVSVRTHAERASNPSFCRHAQRASQTPLSSADLPHAKRASTPGLAPAPHASASTPGLPHAQPVPRRGACIRSNSRHATTSPCCPQTRRGCGSQHRHDGNRRPGKPPQGGGRSSSPHTPCIHPPDHNGSGVRDTRR